MYIICAKVQREHTTKEARVLDRYAESSPGNTYVAKGRANVAVNNISRRVRAAGAAVRGGKHTA
jgi:hypothetical protein